MACEYEVLEAPFCANAHATHILQGVWNTLPENVQALLEERVIEIWLKPLEETILGHAIPIDSSPAFEVAFNVSKFGNLDDLTARHLVAHELAHVYAGHAREPFENDYYYDSDESEADDLAALWGYPCPASLKR
jgi:hypothetical protein